MSYLDFQDKITAYARRANIDAGRITFSTDEGVHRARCNGVRFVGGTANNLVKVIWGWRDYKVSSVYGRPHESVIAM